jgi:hypothetical protein
VTYVKLLLELSLAGNRHKHITIYACNAGFVTQRGVQMKIPEIKEFMVVRCSRNDWGVIIKSETIEKWHIVYKVGGQVFTPGSSGWSFIEEIYEKTDQSYLKFNAIKFLSDPEKFIKEYTLIYRKPELVADYNEMIIKEGNYEKIRLARKTDL